MTKYVVTLAAAVLLSASSPVRAQSARDGTDALARGDVQTAVSVLNPLVESWPAPVPLVDFIMGALYENGIGVPVDRMRACTLYMRASSGNSRLFSETAHELLGSLQQALSADEFGRCVLLVSTGLGHQFQPVTFALEQGHWITLELDSAAITYQWKETRHEIDLALNGVIFLPIKHTPLATSGGLSGRRHFIEVFSWMPGEQQARTWTLLWRVFEVVRDRLDQITQADLGSISAERPPTGPTFDPSRMARLRVSDEGLAMWEVLEGPERGSDIIETADEKEAALEQARARKAIEDRVDWDIVRDVKRRPSLVYSNQGGCANVALYGWSDDRTEAIYVDADKDILGLSTIPRTFDLSSKVNGLTLVVHVYERAIRHGPYCTDLIVPNGPVETWKVVSGRVAITLSPPRAGSRQQNFYQATVQILDAEFMSATGMRVRLPGPVTLSATVGMVMG